LVGVKKNLFSFGILIRFFLPKFYYPFSTEGFFCFLAKILVSFPNVIEMMMEAKVVILPSMVASPFV
jgi:hypothetical protein